MLKSTPSENLKSIEIITNPGSEYQANTSGGVININITKNFAENFSGFLSLTSEQSVFNTTVFNGALNYRKGKIAVKVSPFINNSFNFDRTIYEVETSQNNLQRTIGRYKRDYQVFGGGLGLDYDIDDKNTLSVNGFLSSVNGESNRSGETSYFSEGIEADSIFQSPIIGEDNLFYNFGNIFYQHRFDSIAKKKLTVNLDYNFQQDEAVDNGTFNRVFPNDSSNIIRYRNEFPQDFYNLSGRIDYSSEKNADSKISFGVQVSNSGFDNNLTYLEFDNNVSEFVLNPFLSNKFEYLERYYAAYFEKTKKFGEKVDARFGIRVEGTQYKSENVTTEVEIDSSYINVFPNLSLSYSPNKKNTLSLAFSKRIRRPSVEQLLPGRTFFNPNFFSENNPFLIPNLSYNLDILYALQNKYFFSIGYNFIDNEYGQFILNIEENGDILQQRTFINYGSSESLSFQFYTRQSLFNKFLSSNLSANINYSNYRSSEVILGGFSRVSNFNFSIFFNNTLNISTKKNLVAFANLRYISPSETFSVENIRGLFRTDLGLRKSYDNLSFSVFFSDIFNSYGTSIISNRGPLNLLENSLTQNDFLRSISFSLRYTFGNSNLKTVGNRKSANEDIKKRL